MNKNVVHMSCLRKHGRINHTASTRRVMVPNRVIALADLGGPVKAIRDAKCPRRGGASPSAIEVVPAPVGASEARLTIGISVASWLRTMAANSLPAAEQPRQPASMTNWQSQHRSPIRVYNDCRWRLQACPYGNLLAVC